MKSKIIHFIIFCLILYSCSSEDKKPNKTSINKHGVERFNQNNLETDKLIVTELTKNGTTDWAYSEFKNIFEVTDIDVINNFENLLKKNLVKDYFNAIPELSIAFYNLNNNFKTYRVSIPTNSDTIFIFDDAYQFYYRIHRKEWKKLLIKSKKIAFKEIVLFNLKKAREIYSFCNKNKIPIILNPDYRNQWTLYDGQFKFTISKVEKKINEVEIFENIERNYSNQKYNISVYSWSQTCGCPTCKDCLYEVTFTVNCNKKFYNEFGLYMPKSWYDEYYANFKVLGSNDQLLKIDSLIQKE